MGNGMDTGSLLGFNGDLCRGRKNWSSALRYTML